MANKPDYLKIAILEVETWGEVYTAESKKFQPLRSQRRSGSWLIRTPEADAANVANNNAMLAEMGLD